MARLILCFLLTVLLFSAGEVAAFEPEQEFARANEFYENQDFEAALQIYTDLTDRGYESAALFYNTGNCFFKMGELGYAVLYYLKARRLAPTDDDIEANLDFVRQFMPTRLEGVEVNPLVEFLNLLVDPFTLNRLAWIASLAFIIFILFLAAVVHFHMGGLGVRLIGYLLFVAMVITLGMATYKFRNDVLTEKGVIIATESSIYSAPAADSDVEFVGTYGLTFEVLGAADEYRLVVFENKRRGWIKKDDIEII